MGPTLSACGTVYNNEQSIEKSLNSILELKKHIKDLEVVVVDNYSEDKTWEILNMYAQRHRNLKLYRAKSSHGKGRQIAYEISRGKLVFFIDLDVIHSEAYQKLILYLKNNYKDGEIWYPSYFCSRRVMDESGGWGDFIAGEDFEFPARAICKGIKLKQVMIPIGLDYEPVSMRREQRYAKTTIRWYRRRAKFAVDSFRSGTINLRILWRDSPHLTLTQKILTTLLYPYARYKGAHTYDGKTTIELIAQKGEIVLPSEIGIDIRWLYAPIFRSSRPRVSDDIPEKIRGIKGVKIYEGQKYFYLYVDFNTVGKFIKNNENR